MTDFEQLSTTKKDDIKIKDDFDKLPVEINAEIISRLNTMLERNHLEQSAVYLEASTLVNELSEICTTHYNTPHKKQNRDIKKYNESKDLNSYLNTGHLLIREEHNKRGRDNWDETLRYEIIFKDYNRTRQGIKKYMHRVPSKAKDFLKKDSFALPPFDVRPKGQNGKRTYHEKEIRKCSKAFEYILFKKLKPIISPVIRRYIGMVERFKFLTLERTEALREFAVMAELPLPANHWNCKVQLIEAAIANAYPEINLFLPENKQEN